MLTTRYEPAINLQLFGEDVDDVDSSTAQDGSVTDFFNRIVGTETSQQDDPAQPNQQDTLEQPKEDFVDEPLIMGKFKTQEDLEKAYKEAEKRISLYGQQQSQNQQQINRMQEQLQQLQQFTQQIQNKPLTPDEIEKKNQEWLDKFYENPMDTLGEVVTQSIQQVVNPINERIQYQENVDRYNQQVSIAKQRYPDFDSYVPRMQEIIKEQGQYLSTLPNAVDIIYNIAKAQTIQSPDDYIKDNNFRQKIIQDETIRNEILKQYAEQIKNGQPPVLLSDQPGEIPSIEPMDIKSTQDAKKAAISFFQRLAGGGSK